MPILPPSLDDRRFDDLVEDLLRRIPAHTPEWTHPRVGDPGRTVLELFAWLTDTLLYRANLVPERQRLVFLRLLGQPLRPARPATGIVTLNYRQATELSATPLLSGARIGGPIPFETLGETTVLPITAAAYIKRPLNESEAARMSEVIVGLQRLHRLTQPIKAYETFPVFTQSRPDPAGLDVFATSADRALWLALLAPPAQQPDRQAEVNAAVRSALGGGDTGAPALLSVGVVPALTLPADIEDAATITGPRPRIPVIWEISAPGPRPRTVDYLTLDPLDGSDTTRGLTRPGVIRLSLPDESLLAAPSNDVAENPAAGVGDTPPRLDDADQAARLIAWLRLRPEPGQTVESLRLSWVGINAVEIDQRVTITGRVLGVSSGAGDQAFSLPLTSVDRDSLRIEVEEPGRGYQPWFRVDDLAAISADPGIAREASAYEVDAEAGTLRFGDGVRGRVPEHQMRIRLASARFGGGRAGNLPAGSLTEILATRVAGGSAPPLRLEQPLALTGGEDAETVDLAERRIPAFLRHRDRAVTAGDYARIATETPGVDVGRVEVLPRFKPRDRRFDVPGVVSVLALPARTLSGPPNPRPDRPFIEQVHAHLQARSPLSTELYVIGCEYVPLGLSVGVSLRDGYARDRVLFEVREALRRLLWPLPPGGPLGAGWPLPSLQRDPHPSVRERELHVEISRVPGVREVTGLNLFEHVALPGGDDWRPLVRNPNDGTQTLSLSAWQLPELLSVIVVEGPAAPDNLRALPNPFADADAVAVPVVPEVC